MTGPEHYAEAERIMTERVMEYMPGKQMTLSAADAGTLAQAHATLALAAATALHGDHADIRAWREVTRQEGR